MLNWDFHIKDWVAYESFLPPTWKLNIVSVAN